MRATKGELDWMDARKKGLDRLSNYEGHELVYVCHPDATPTRPGDVPILMPDGSLYGKNYRYFLGKMTPKERRAYNKKHRDDFAKAQEYDWLASKKTSDAFVTRER